MSVTVTSNHTAMLKRILDAQQAIKSQDRNRLLQIFHNIHHADAAHIIHMIGFSYIDSLIDMLGANFNPAILNYLNESVQEKIISRWEVNKLRSTFANMDKDDARDILENLSPNDRSVLLRAIAPNLRTILSQSLKYSRSLCGSWMRTQFIALPQTWSVKRTKSFIAYTQNLPDFFPKIYVLDMHQSVIGQINIINLLKASEDRELYHIMDTQLITIAPDTPIEQVNNLFRRYGLVSCPVVEHGKLVGEITADIVLESIHENAEEDLLRIGRVLESDLYDSILERFNSRIFTLGINLILNFVTVFFISLFEDRMRNIPGLLILIPIVAATAGNAGMQVMVITIRDLANGELSDTNYRDNLNQEVQAAVIQSLALSILLLILITAVQTFTYSLQYPLLRVIVPIALGCNIIFGCLVGIAIPSTLRFFKLDPVSGSTFLTVCTDWMGYIISVILALCFII